MLVKVMDDTQTLHYRLALSAFLCMQGWRKILTTSFLKLLKNWLYPAISGFPDRKENLGSMTLIIDREARETMHLVASVHPSVRLSVCAFTAEPFAAKSIRSDYQSKVFVCVSVIRGHIRIITRMRSIGVLIFTGFLIENPCKRTAYT